MSASAMPAYRLWQIIEHAAGFDDDPDARTEDLQGVGQSTRRTNYRSAAIHRQIGKPIPMRVGATVPNAICR